jgi:hypothetical protein
VPDQVSPRDLAKLRDLTLLVDGQPAADVEAEAMAAGAFAPQPPGPSASQVAGDPGRISRRSRLLRGQSIAPGGGAGVQQPRLQPHRRHAPGPMDQGHHGGQSLISMGILALVVARACERGHLSSWARTKSPGPPSTLSVPPGPNSNRRHPSVWNT